MTITARSIWNNFCSAHQITNNRVPLFATDGDRNVNTKEIGSKTKRSILVRHEKMENLMLRETDILIRDWHSKSHEYDGLIYMMHRYDADDQIVPLYIGKAEAIGRGDGNLSANIANLHRDKSKFARWGDNYAYHIGDLSAAILPGHQPQKINPKYLEWGSRLFVTAPTDRPKLKHDIYFWAKAWRKSDISIWQELSPTRLAFLEYLLIGVASTLFDGSLLNYEGRNRNGIRD